MASYLQVAPTSNTALWAGRVMSGLVVLFLLFDATIKLIPLEIVNETRASSAFRSIWPARSAC